MRQISDPSGWNRRWSGDRTKPLGTMPVPEDLLMPDAHSPKAPNAWTDFPRLTINLANARLHDH